MIVNAILLVVSGLFCLIGTIISVIFTIISFANHKSSKYGWLTGFLVCLAGLILCIFIFVRKAVNKVENFANTLNSEMTSSMQDYSDSVAFTSESFLQSNEQIRLLKTYYKDSTSVPEQFYYYLGFENYYRFPLRYPYSIHCSPFKDAGELYNEIQVNRFDENDNGEIPTSIDKIDRLAFDQNYLLIDQKKTSTRSADFTHHYMLFSFETQKTEEANSEKELLKLAKQKGYKGSDKLVTMETYGELFQ